MGFSSEVRKELRPIDLLLFNWLHGKDAYVDVTGGSPLVGVGLKSLLFGPWCFFSQCCGKKEKEIYC